jgi:hypothetical protein
MGGKIMDFIQTAIEFVKTNWAELVAGITTVIAVYLKGQKLYYSFKYGSVKKMYQQIKTFKDETTGLVDELKNAGAQMQAVAKLTYELGRQANIAVDAKKKMQEIIKTVTADVEDIVEEVPQDVTIEQEVENNNKTISEILGEI